MNKMYQNLFFGNLDSMHSALPKVQEFRRGQLLFYRHGVGNQVEYAIWTVLKVYKTVAVLGVIDGCCPDDMAHDGGIARINIPVTEDTDWRVLYESDTDTDITDIITISL